MKDRIVEHSGRIKATDVETGDEYIFDVERAEGIVTEEGTAYNKANVLTDEVAVELGLTDAATPNDAFRALFSMINNIVDADNIDY